MQYIDPFPVVCDKCGNQDVYPLDKIRSLEAYCIKCEHSFKQVSVEINDHHKKVGLYFSVVEIIIEIEDSFSIKIADDEAEKILTLKDLLVITSYKTERSIETLSSEVIRIIGQLGCDISNITNYEKLLSEFKIIQDS